ncbi:collagen alpha-1(I) chain-like [Hyaena hyaena]|uniref:collagen alpha-1(I) chain-like n=1 Tax=Hyaena hyaena TaxID=95912 RepID=UPI0019215853|nr:collagen alpha-1(I) chain-like [Hyaena hyaena]
MTMENFIQQTPVTAGGACLMGEQQGAHLVVSGRYRGASRRPAVPGHCLSFCKAIWGRHSIETTELARPRGRAARGGGGHRGRLPLDPGGVSNRGLSGGQPGGDGGTVTDGPASREFGARRAWTCPAAAEKEVAAGAAVWGPGGRGAGPGQPEGPSRKLGRGDQGLRGATWNALRKCHAAGSSGVDADGPFLSPPPEAPFTQEALCPWFAEPLTPCEAPPASRTRARGWGSSCRRNSRLSLRVERGCPPGVRKRRKVGVQPSSACRAPGHPGQPVLEGLRAGPLTLRTETATLSKLTSGNFQKLLQEQESSFSSFTSRTSSPAPTPPAHPLGQRPVLPAPPAGCTAGQRPPEPQGPADRFSDDECLRDGIAFRWVFHHRSDNPRDETPDLHLESSGTWTWGPSCVCVGQGPVGLRGVCEHPTVRGHSSQRPPGSEGREGGPLDEWGHGVWTPPEEMGQKVSEMRLVSRAGRSPHAVTASQLRPRGSGGGAAPQGVRVAGTKRDPRPPAGQASVRAEPGPGTPRHLWRSLSGTLSDRACAPQEQACRGAKPRPGERGGDTLPPCPQAAASPGAVPGAATCLPPELPERMPSVGRRVDRRPRPPPGSRRTRCPSPPAGARAVRLPSPSPHGHLSEGRPPSPLGRRSPVRPASPEPPPGGLQGHRDAPREFSDATITETIREKAVGPQRTQLSAEVDIPEHEVLEKRAFRADCWLRNSIQGVRTGLQPAQDGRPGRTQRTGRGPPGPPQDGELAVRTHGDRAAGGQGGLTPHRRAPAGASPPPCGLGPATCPTPVPALDAPCRRRTAERGWGAGSRARFPGPPTLFLPPGPTGAAQGAPYCALGPDPTPPADKHCSARSPVFAHLYAHPSSPWAVPFLAFPTKRPVSVPPGSCRLSPESVQHSPGSSPWGPRAPGQGCCPASRTLSQGPSGPSSVHPRPKETLPRLWGGRAGGPARRKDRFWRKHVPRGLRKEFGRGRAAQPRGRHRERPAGRKPPAPSPLPSPAPPGVLRGARPALLPPPAPFSRRKDGRDV